MRRERTALCNVVLQAYGLSLADAPASSTALQLIRVGYGPMGSSTESIAPHEFVCARTLDYIGPWDLPASSVMVSGKEGEVAPTMDSRYWLTW